MSDVTNTSNLSAEGARDLLEDRLLLDGLANSTVAQYRAMIARWWRWATGEGYDPAVPRSRAVREWSETLAPGVSTRDQAKACIRHWCDLAGVPDTSDAVLRPEKSLRARRSPLRREQAAALLDAADQHGRRGTPIYLGLYAAMRISEIAKLRWDGVDLETNTIRFWRDKVDSWYAVPLHPTLRRHLEVSMPADGFVFQSRNQGHMAKGTLYGWVKDVAEAAGLPDVQPHDLRRTCAKMVYEAGDRKDIMAAKEILGHSKVTTTQVYLGVAFEELRDGLIAVDYR